MDERAVRIVKRFTSYTNRAQGWHGSTISVTARLPDPVVRFMDEEVDPEVLRNRSEFLQHWATVGMLVMSNPELSEALAWALEQHEPATPTILDVPMVVDLDAPVVDENLTVVRPPPPVDVRSEAPAPLSARPMDEPWRRQRLAPEHEAILDGLRSRLR